MDFNNILNNIRDSKSFQYGLAATVFGIIVYSGISLFQKKDVKGASQKSVENAIAPVAIKTTEKKGRKSVNQKRIIQEMEIDYKKANNPNEVYISPHETENTGVELKNYQFKIENKIYQNNFKEKEKSEKNKKTSKSENRDAPPPLLSNKPEIKKNDTNAVTDVPLQLNVLETEVDKNNIQDKIELYADIYSYSHPAQNNGKLVVKESYWEEYNKKLGINRKNQNPNNITTRKNTVSNYSAQSQQTNVVKVVPGSSYFAKLLIPVENIYAGSVKPIAEIVDGNLKGYKLIGNVVLTQTNNGLIFKFNRLISPNGLEFGINAVAVQVKNLSPKFVDSLDRHIFPRITLATLTTVADALFNGENNNYSAPAQSVLSQELQNVISEYQTEIKVNPKYFVIVFY